MATLWKWIKRMFWLVIILVMFTYSTRGPSKSKFDNAWNNMKYTVTRLTGHEFAEASSVPKVATVRQPRGPNGETPDSPVKNITEEILKPGKWFTVHLKGEGLEEYRSIKVTWKSGPIYRRYLNSDGEVMLTTLGIGETSSGKTIRVDDCTLQPVEKKFSDGKNVQGVAAVQFMPANGKVPVKVRLEID